MDEPEYNSFESLFPMRMTSIEKFHWFDDCPEFPNLVFCRLRIDGRLDPGIAKQAWQIAVQRQPFGDVHPQKIKGRWCWVAGPRGQGETNRDFDTWNGTRFEFEEFAVPPEDWSFAEHKIRSSTGSYLGVFVAPAETPAETPAQSTSEIISEVWLYVHHAVGDGAGSILVINEWMVIYANLKSGRSPEKGLHRLDPKLLKQRNSLGLLTWRYAKHLYKQPIALFGATKFIFRKTAELVPNLKGSKQTTAETTKQYPAILGRWVDEAQVNSLANHASEHNVMGNSVLLGQMYLAIADWRTKEGGHSDKDWMRVILPMSIRNVSDRRLPTANRATIVQIDRRSADMVDLAKFYQGLNREVMIIRGWQLDKMFLLVIRLLSLFEPILKRAARDEKSRGMAVFTNLGEPLRKSERAGSREPESDAFIRPYEFDLVGPIRTGTPVNFSASRYGPRLRISMQYDHRLISRQRAEDLLNGYVDRLNRI